MSYRQEVVGGYFLLACPVCYFIRDGGKRAGQQVGMASPEDTSLEVKIRINASRLWPYQ